MNINEITKTIEKRQKVIYTDTDAWKHYEKTKVRLDTKYSNLKLKNIKKAELKLDITELEDKKFKKYDSTALVKKKKVKNTLNILIPSEKTSYMHCFSFDKIILNALKHNYENVLDFDYSVKCEKADMRVFEKISERRFDKQSRIRHFDKSEATSGLFELRFNYIATLIYSPTVNVIRKLCNRHIEEFGTKDWNGNNNILQRVSFERKRYEYIKLRNKTFSHSLNLKNNKLMRAEINKLLFLRDETINTISILEENILKDITIMPLYREFNERICNIQLDILRLNINPIQSKKFIRPRKRKHNELVQPLQQISPKTNSSNKYIILNSRLENKLDNFLKDKSIIKIIFEEEYMQGIDIILNIYSCIIFLTLITLDEFTNLESLFRQINRIYFKFDEIFLIHSFSDKKLISILDNYISKHFDPDIVKVTNMSQFNSILKFHENVYEYEIPTNPLLLEFSKYPYLNPLEIIYFFRKHKTAEIIQKYRNRNMTLPDVNAIINRLLY
jgi:hypothetical protein